MLTSTDTRILREGIVSAMNKIAMGKHDEAISLLMTVNVSMKESEED